MVGGRGCVVNNIFIDASSMDVTSFNQIVVDPLALENNFRAIPEE
ncbi:MAG: hypothetical protein ACI8ZB_001697 [Desulforhopalus sp.]|jgi:hypothetical protein